MYVELENEDELLEAALRLAPVGDEQLMVWVADRSAHRLPGALRRLSENGLAYFGAVFPGLVAGRRRMGTGALVNKVPVAGGPRLVEMRAGGPDWSAQLPVLPAGGSRRLTVAVFVDCLSPGINDLLKQLFHRYGGRVDYFGAGGGTGQLEPLPVIFHDGEPRGSAAVVALLDLQGAISVRHGWSRARGPFVATRTSKNVIEELNWEPALEVYQRELSPHLSEPLTAENFFRATGAHPFGIEREGGEDVVRDPIKMTDGGGLVCLSDVPEQSVMHILHSDLDDLTGAVQRALEECREKCENEPRRCFVVDCFSRALLLDDEFSLELDTMMSTMEGLAPGVVPEGVLALGEIASDGRRLPELYNKTFVAGMFDG